MKNYIILVSLALPLFLVNCTKPTGGCTDPYATNFNANADEDNGTCTYVENVRGCTNPLSENYDPAATIDDGSCIIRGCTNPLSPNYNPNANVEDGSCIDLREDFFGTWLISSSCGFDFNLNDTVTIIPDTTNADIIFFQYLSGDQNLNFATVDGKNLDLPEQNLDGGFFPVTFTGEGELNDDNNEILIEFTYDSFFGEQTCEALLEKL